MKTRTFFSYRTLFIVLILLLLSLGLCRNTSAALADGVVSKGQTTIVFIDKTMSTKLDSVIQEKNTSWLRKVIKEHLLQSGDKIIVSFIFENTASPSNLYEFTYRPPMPKMGNMSSSEARLEKVKYNRRLRGYQKSFTQKVIQKSFSSEANRKTTDVVGTIKLLSDISKDDSGNNLHVYYFSDMLECTSFRSLNAKILKSFENAQTLGKKDVSRIKQRYQLADNCLKNIPEVVVIFPATEMDSNKAFVLLPEYWNVVFKSFGVSIIHYY